MDDGGTLILIILALALGAFFAGVLWRAHAEQHLRE